MYAEFFGLRELPFNNTPDPRFFYSTPDHEEALASLIYAVQERKGFALLTGEVGAGKTLISRMMLRHFGNRIVFANINHSVNNADDLLASVCTEFDIAVPADAGNSQLVRALHDFLLSRFGQDVPTVLVLDEAQALPDDAFEQLRMIGNLEADDAKLLQIVIVGQPELQERFQLPNMRQLRQRIFRSFHLPALTQSLTEAYIQHRISIAGGDNVAVFDGYAVERIYDQSKGLPRLINAICDNAMLSAYSANRRLVDGPFVESVIRQMMLFDQNVFAQAMPAASYPAVASRGYEPAPMPISGQMARPVMGPTAVCANFDQSGGALEANPAHLQPQFAAQPHDWQMKMRGLEQRISQLEEQRNGRMSAVAAAQSVFNDLWPLVEQARSLLNETQSGSQKLAEREERVARMATKLKTVIEEIRRVNAGLSGSVGKVRRAERHAQAIYDRLCRQSARSREVVGALRSTVSEVGRREAAVENQVALLDEASSAARAVVDGVRNVEKFEQVLRKSQSTLTDLRDLSPSSKAPARAANGLKPDGAASGPSTVRLSQQVEGLLRLVGSEADEPTPAKTAHA